VLPKSTEIDSQRVPVCCQPETVLIGFLKIALYAVVRFVPVQVLDAKSELIPRSIPATVKWLALCLIGMIRI